MNEEDELYKENILDHYRNPHNKRKIEQATIMCKELNPSCGDEIELFLKIEDGKIADASFQGQGCAISQASVSMLTDAVKGKKVEDAGHMHEKEVIGMLGIPLGPSRMKCALLSLKTLQK